MDTPRGIHPQPGTDIAGLLPRSSSPDESAALLTRIVAALSGSREPAAESFAVVASWVNSQAGLPGDLLSLAMTAATCRINLRPFAADLLEGSEVLVKAVAGQLAAHGLTPAIEQLGIAIDIWSQASGREVENPTGRWHMQMDALRRGWRRPRLGRAYYTSTKLPTAAEYCRAILGNVPFGERAICLQALVRQGMNQDLALELAAYEGADVASALAARLAAGSESQQEYPPLVHQALNLSRSLARLTVAAVSGDQVTVPEADRHARLQRCMKCDAFARDSYRCRHCGCYLKAKLPLATEHCPLWRW